MHDVKRTAGSSSKWLSNANSLFLVTTHQISPDLRAFDQFLFPQVREFVFCPPLFFCSKVRIGSVWPGGCRLCKLWRARQVESPWHGWLGWLPCSQPLSVICPRQNWHPGHTQWFPNPKKMKAMAIWSHGNVRRFQVLKRYWRLNLALPISCMPFPSISMTSRSFTPMSSRLSLALAPSKGIVSSAAFASRSPHLRWASTSRGTKPQRWHHELSSIRGSVHVDSKCPMRSGRHDGHHEITFHSSDASPPLPGPWGCARSAGCDRDRWPGICSMAKNGWS